MCSSTTDNNLTRWFEEDFPIPDRNTETTQNDSQEDLDDAESSRYDEITDALAVIWPLL